MTTRNLAYALGTAVTVFLLWYFSDIVGYIIAAWVVSMVGEPLMDFFQTKIRIRNWRMGPSTAAVLTILTFFAVFALVLVIFVPQIVAQGRHLAELDYGRIGQKLEPSLKHLNDLLHDIGALRGKETLGTKVQEALQRNFSPIIVGDYVGGALSAAGGVLASVTSTIFILFFFLREKNLLADLLHAVVPDKLEGKVVHAIDESKSMLTRYFRGLVVQALCFTTVCMLTLLLLGVDSALLIGAFGGMANVVPYVGPILGFVFGAFITVSSNIDADMWTVVLPLVAKVGAAFVVAQAMDNLILGPIIFSKSVAAHPLEIFVVIMVGAKLGGVMGMVVAIPVYTVARVVARIFFNEFKLVQKITGE